MPLPGFSPLHPPILGPDSPALEFIQKPANPLPLHLILQDETSQPVPLARYFGKAPVILVLGYFHCPNLCSTLLDGVLESLAQAAPPNAAYQFLAVSIDPRETPAAASQKKDAYLPILPRNGSIHFLTGPADATRSLAASVGFPYLWDEKLAQYSHPAGFVVATPDGRIARYFLGVRFPPGELRLALAEAAAGRTGSFTDRLLLLCSHYDPRSGRYTLAAMTFVRIGSGLVVLALAFWLWRRRAGRAS